MRSIFTLLAISVIAHFATSNIALGQCGCENYPACGCERPASKCCVVHSHRLCRNLFHHKHCCCCECCCGTEQSRMMSIRAAEPPVAPVVGSMPMVTATPTMMMMPMMLGMRAASFEQPRSSRSRGDDDCHDRIDELDARVEALHLRMQTIQRSVEFQTRILEEIKSKGEIGGQKIPTQ